jgi:hypothetical protein
VQNSLFLNAMPEAAVQTPRGECFGRAHPVNWIFALYALAARKMQQVQNHLRCHAAGKPAIRARHSKTNPANSRVMERMSRHVEVVSLVNSFQM